MPPRIDNPDRWYSAFGKASRTKRYDMLMDALDEDNVGKSAQTLGLDMCVGDVFDELCAANRVDMVSALADRLRAKLPALWTEMCQFFEAYFVRVALFQGRRDEAFEHASVLAQQPVERVDYFFASLEALRLYGHTDSAADLSRKTFDEISRSKALMSGSENTLTVFIVDDLVQKCCQDFRAGRAIDWDRFVEESERYGAADMRKYVDNLDRCLRTPFNGGEAFLPRIFEDQEDSRRALMMRFAAYMYDEKHVKFGVAHDLWREFFEFLGGAAPRGREKRNPERILRFSRQALDERCGKMIGAFLSPRQHTAVSLLWGIPYFYDLLLSERIIKPELHKDVLRTVHSLKSDVVTAFGSSLWRYDFVHRWGRPDSVPETAFAEETNRFRASFAEQPLDDAKRGAH